jgi:Fic family protein
MSYLPYVIVGAAGIILGIYMGRKSSGKGEYFSSKTEKEMDELRDDAKKALGRRSDDRKKRILEFMREAREDFKMGCNLRGGENKKGITREEVEKLLDISRATALRYLNELEKEGKIKQVGQTGRSVCYELIS